MLYAAVLPAAATEVESAAYHQHEGIDMFGGPAYGHIHLDMTDDQPAVEQIDSQCYKLAGNSIVVACMEGIFLNLFSEQETEQLTLF